MSSRRSCPGLSGELAKINRIIMKFIVSLYCHCHCQTSFLLNDNITETIKIQTAINLMSSRRELAGIKRRTG
jgi:hypothetical protein